MKIGAAEPEKYRFQLEEKCLITQEEFKQFNPPKLEVFASPPSHYRMRAEFKIWHEAEHSYYVMFPPGEKRHPIKVDEFSIGSHKINELMPKLMASVQPNELLRRKLFQVEFLTTTTDEALITLIYHKKLDQIWEREARALSQTLNVKLIGRSRGQKLILNSDDVTEEFHLNNGHYKYQQVETGFTQPNGFVCQDMLNWACDVSEHLEGDLLELYCGNGNFTLPLAKCFRKVLATEVAKISVNSARHNIELNQCKNITIARLSSEEFTQAINREREFHRLKDIDLQRYDFSTVFVDPPRSGLDEQTTQMIQQFENIIYISCNPETLKSNLLTLNKTHKIARFALFDQFPYTPHRECGVLLEKC